MKYFVFPFTETDLNCFTEIFFVIPFLSEGHYQKVIQAANIWNEGLYAKLRFAQTNVELVSDIKECDISIIPFKYSKEDKRIEEFCSSAKEQNKKVICFCNDDSSEVFDLPSNLYLFRTSIDNKLKKLNERGYPVLIPDHFPSNIDLYSAPENYGLTFCGFPGNNRKPILEQIINQYKYTNFMYRSGFWAPELSSKQAARKEFYTNLLSGSFAFCIRGNGNFSYRFYEALSFGRIPVLFDTDCVLPFNNVIDWNNHIITIKTEDIPNLESILRNSNGKISPQANRKLWETHFSPEGYYDKFILDV
jgi:Exostosin family